MPLASDITIDISRFHPDSITQETKEICAAIEENASKVPYWFEIGAVKFRQMLSRGEGGGFPAPVLLPGAVDAALPSRDAGRDIPIRVYKPDHGESKGVVLHIHGGGWTLFSHRDFDGTLQFYANNHHVTTISVGYRLAPEHPAPAAIQDCIDAAEYLVDHATDEYGGELSFIVGESAGANLTMTTALGLLRSRPGFSLKGLICAYGMYALSGGSPSMRGYERHLIINETVVEAFVDSYTPGWSFQKRQDPSISPLFEDLQNLASKAKGQTLPPVLFVCGTADPVLDDSMLMSLKWMATGSEAIVKIFPGGWHGLDLGNFTLSKECREYYREFIAEKMASSE
ncbi:acetyl esterase [Xylariaceae sp. FL0255]|nr:acetyl esterase [Xylariaceae sp. FL0255]